MKSVYVSYASRTVITCLGAAGKEGDGATIVVLGGFWVLLDDFDAVGRLGEVTCELVGGYEACE